MEPYPIEMVAAVSAAAPSLHDQNPTDDEVRDFLDALGQRGWVLVRTEDVDGN